MTLGVKVYPLPELTTSSEDTEPFVTVAFNCAGTDPAFVGTSTITAGGFVSLYPLPPCRRVELLTPLTRVAAEAPNPDSELIVTLGGYSNL